MSHALIARDEAGQVRKLHTPVAQHRPVEQFHPIAGRIVERGEARDLPQGALLGGAGAGLDARGLDTGYQVFQIGTVQDLEADGVQSWYGRLGDYQSRRVVVHAVVQ